MTDPIKIAAERFLLRRLRDWDVAAPHLVLQEAGGFLTQFEGLSFEYSGSYEKQGVVAVSSLELLREINRIVAGYVT